MIYEFPEAAAPLRQGDIFRRVPRIDLSLRTLTLTDENGQLSAATWEQIAANAETPRLVVAAASVPAIVISQDCDLAHGQDVSLCEIRPFKDVEATFAGKKSAKGRVDSITQQAKKNLKWFYLPANERIGFAENMGADFRVTIRVPRDDLAALRAQRVGRLLPEADEHFRERLAEFFRRYPVDEWYSLTKDEFAAYREAHPDAQPREWQR